MFLTKDRKIIEVNKLIVLLKIEKLLYHVQTKSNEGSYFEKEQNDREIQEGKQILVNIDRKDDFVKIRDFIEKIR